MVSSLIEHYTRKSSNRISQKLRGGVFIGRIRLSLVGLGMLGSKVLTDLFFQIFALRAKIWKK